MNPLTPRKQRKRIRPDDKVPLELSDRERQIVVEKTFAPDELTDRIRLAPVSKKGAKVAFTLDDWEHLQGYIAAEANHCEIKSLAKELDGLFDRIQGILENYTDQEG